MIHHERLLSKPKPICRSTKLTSQYPKFMVAHQLFPAQLSEIQVPLPIGNRYKSSSVQSVSLERPHQVSNPFSQSFMAYEMLTSKPDRKEQVKTGSFPFTRDCRLHSIRHLRESPLLHPFKSQPSILAMRPPLRQFPFFVSSEVTPL